MAKVRSDFSDSWSSFLVPPLLLLFLFFPSIRFRLNTRSFILFEPRSYLNNRNLGSHMSSDDLPSGHHALRSLTVPHLLDRLLVTGSGVPQLSHRHASIIISALNTHQDPSLPFIGFPLMSSALNKRITLLHISQDANDFEYMQDPLSRRQRRFPASITTRPCISLGTRLDGARC